MVKGKLNISQQTGFYAKVLIAGGPKQLVNALCIKLLSLNSLIYLVRSEIFEVDPEIIKHPNFFPLKDNRQIGQLSLLDYVIVFRRDTDEYINLAKQAASENKAKLKQVDLGDFSELTGLLSHQEIINLNCIDIAPPSTIKTNLTAGSEQNIIISTDAHIWEETGCRRKLNLSLKINRLKPPYSLMSNINNRILSQINSFNLGKFKLNKFKVRSLRYTIGLVVLLLLVNLGLFVPYVINLTYQRNISNLFSLYTKDKFGQWSSVDIAKIKSSQNTAKRFALASRVFPYFSTSRSIVRLEPFINQSFWLAEGWYDLSQVENQLLKKVISRQEINNNDINLVKDAISRFDRRIVDFQAELIQPETEALIKKYVSDFDIKETKSLVVDLRLNLQKETLLIESMPKILAFKDNKSYVVIIQNNFELRSTGGLIDAYGYINFENGRLTGWRFFDADEMEKSLYARLEPPASLKRSLGESTWYFRDANWEVDFAVAAGRVLWFTEKGDKLIADGAMATDLKFWTQLSAILGGVNDISSGTLKDKDTVFKEMVTWASKDRLSLSAGVFCRDFVNSIVDNITQQVNQEEIVNKIRRQISQSIKQKDILLYFKDLEIQKIMANLGWDGKIKKFLPPADQKNIMADYLMINEANVGVNLANYFINRYITQQIEVSQNEINEQLRIKYSNGSNLNSWPGGSYKTYLRIYLPKEAILDSISLRQDQQTVPVNLTNLDSGTFEEKGYYGLLVEVLPRKETEVTVNYRNKTRVFDNKLATYLLLFQKQPGVESYDYTLEVKTLGDLVPLQLIPSGEISANGLQVNQSIREDQIFQADFGK